MSGNIFVTATEARSGKSVISLGLMELLLRNVDKVGFFRPFINTFPGMEKRDNDIDLISAYYKLETPYREMYAYTTKETHKLIARGKEDKLLEGIFNKYKKIEKLVKK